MTELYLGFKAFDMHELLCHFVAQEAGFYRSSGIDARLLDTTFVPDNQLPTKTFQVACGGALAGWLNGAPQKVVFVATEKPMFWLYSDAVIDDMALLEGKRVASFPGIAPPAQFLSAILKQTPVDIQSIQIEPARDDTARLGLLASGNVSAAVISSAIPPALMEDMGFRQVLYFGSHIRVPSSGLAVSEALLDTEKELVTTMVDIFQRSLKLIHSDNELLKKVLVDHFRLPESHSKASCDMVKTHFGATGSCASEVTQNAITLMADELGVSREDIPTNELYDFRFLNPLQSNS